MASPEPFPDFKIDAAQLVTDAIAEHDPSHVFDDSAVLTSWAKMKFGHKINAAVFIDTGTALPGVREFAEAFCAYRHLPLIVLEAGDAYQRMVREHGVPGPGAHLYPYVWLKERQLDALVAEHKTRWNDRIMLLAGARRAESVRRMGKAVPLERDGCTVWVNPLIDWTDHDMHAYRERWALEQSDVAALLHRSGECNCGAFASPGEREMLRSLYPAWYDATIAPLEAHAAHRGLPCIWGERWTNPVDGEGRVGRLCVGCPGQLALSMAA